MKILIEAHHPAHIHFWKYVVRELLQRGHEVRMIARDRDVMRRLLDVYDWIPVEIPKRRNRNNRFPVFELLQRQWKVARTIQSFGPDVVASLMGSYTQTAKLSGIRNLIFTDSEFQQFNHRIAHPFADEIYTPNCFYKRLGHKQIFYNGIHELMFLRKGVYQPNPGVLTRYGDLEKGSYLIIRISAWNTLHDIGNKGLGESVRKFIHGQKDKYRIIVSGEEEKVPPSLDVEIIQPKPEDFHDLLYYSAFVLTEGASTASESACMGVPTVYINSTAPRGYLQMLEQVYGNVKSFSVKDEAIECANDWLSSLDPIDWGQREDFRQKIHEDLPHGHEFVVERLLKPQEN